MGSVKIFDNNGLFSQYTSMNSSRSFFQLWQRPFDPTSETPYYLLFQRVYGRYHMKYHQPKILSSTKRSVCFFKYVTRPAQMRLRYTAAQCSECLEYFSLFNTTKNSKTWEDITNPPKISRKLLEVKNIFMCTDCIWLYEALDDPTEAPPTPPLIPVPHNSPSSLME